MILSAPVIEETRDLPDELYEDQPEQRRLLEFKEKKRGLLDNLKSKGTEVANQVKQKAVAKEKEAVTSLGNKISLRNEDQPEQRGFLDNIKSKGTEVANQVKQQAVAKAKEAVTSLGNKISLRNEDQPEQRFLDNFKSKGTELFNKVKQQAKPNV